MKALIAMTIVPLVWMSESALGQEGERPFSIDGYVGIVTDYRDRGLSLSDRDIAVTGSLGLFHENGFYIGVDAASIDNGFGADVRTELFAGYTVDKGDYIYNVSFELDGIHGNGSDYYPELKASVARDFGLAFTRFGTAFAPDGRWSAPQSDSLYFYGDVELPVPTMPSLTIVTHLGHDFRSDINNLWDWSVGLSAFVGDVEFTATYDKSSLDQRIGRGRFIVGARLYF